MVLKWPEPGWKYEVWNFKDKVYLSQSYSRVWYSLGPTLSSKLKKVKSRPYSRRSHSGIVFIDWKSRNGTTLGSGVENEGRQTILVFGIINP